MKQFSAEYFLKTSKIAQRFTKNQIVTMQFFQRGDDVMLCGMNEVLQLLKKHTNLANYQVKYLPEQTIINPKDVVLELHGPYQEFGFLEGVIDGILARQSSLATNAYQLKKVIGQKQVVFMGDRADHYLNQKNDGYAIACGGILTQVTKAQIHYHRGMAVGTMPHVLIQMFQGDLVKALSAYHATFPNEPLTALVDFNNDVIGDTLKALRAFGEKLSAVRVDTSPNMIDKYFEQQPLKQGGVNLDLVNALRKALNEHQGQHVKIIVSSGFDKTKISEFEKAKAPVDVYGVGASLLKINLQFTADAVLLNGQKLAKAGRGYQPMMNFKVLQAPKKV